MKRGLVVGKFYPFHKGHSYLIAQAEAHSDEVIVLVCASERYNDIDPALRKTWIEETHPDVTVRIIPDLENDNNSEAWAQHTIDFLGYHPDIVFSSETYGERYAHYMNARHHLVDMSRHTVPISGTEVRRDIIRSWKYLPNSTRRDMALRVVVLGAESTGTTTLARDLAKALNTTWVPEYGRFMSEGLFTSEHEWNDTDFVHIAQAQRAAERQLAMHSNGILICDTNATVTQFWQKRYLGCSSNHVKTVARHDTPVLYILTGDEIPFVDDGLRDGEAIRHDMHNELVNFVTQSNTPYSIVSGSPQKRLADALRAVKNACDYESRHRYETKVAAP